VTSQETPLQTKSQLSQAVVVVVVVVLEVVVVVALLHGVLNISQSLVPLNGGVLEHTHPAGVQVPPWFVQVPDAGFHRHIQNPQQSSGAQVVVVDVVVPVVVVPPEVVVVPGGRVVVVCQVQGVSRRLPHAPQEILGT
jgi:hypothetical protein